MLCVYTALRQPATCWTDTHCDPPITLRWPGNRLLVCRCCGQRRPAKNCVVQSYYDAVMIWCADGKGCKHPKTIAAKARRAFQNRSAGQKARRR